MSDDNGRGQGGRGQGGRGQGGREQGGREDGLPEAVLSEQRELVSILAEIRRAVAARNCTKNELDDLMTRLCDLIEKHFLREQQGGYLQAILDRAPQYGGHARILQDQHEALLEEVKKLRALVHSGVESSAWWFHVESNFHKLASGLQMHEQAVTKVVQGVSTEDTVTKD